MVNVKNEARCKKKGRRKPSRWVYQKVRKEQSKAEGFEGRECLAGLFREFSNVCKCSLSEGMDPAEDVERSW